MSVLPEGSVRVKAGKDVTLECVSSGEPRSAPRWTRVGYPARLDPWTLGMVDSHAVLKVRPSLGVRFSLGPRLGQGLRKGVREGR